MKKFISLLLSAAIVLSVFVPCLPIKSFSAEQQNSVLTLKRDLKTNGIYLRANNAQDGQVMIIARYDNEGVLKWVSSRQLDNGEGYTCDSEICTEYASDDVFKGFLWNSFSDITPVAQSCEMIAGEIEKPALWLDAADISTVTAEDGKVSRWADKSGNGRDVYQESEANRPTYAEGEYIETNGNNSVPTYLENNMPFMAKSTEPITIFIAMELDMTKPTGHFMTEGSLSSNNPSYDYFFNSDTSGGLIVRNGSKSTTQVPLPIGYCAPGNQIQVITDTKEFISVASMRNDKTVVMTPTSYQNRISSKDNFDVFSIGGRKCYDKSITVKYATPAKFKEILIYQKEFTEGEKLEIQEYLTTKWGVDPALPDDNDELVTDTLSAVSIDPTSTVDTQNAYYYLPSKALDYDAEPVPLVVGLHSWSATYTDASKSTYANLAKEKGWAMIHPDFRGANDDPSACASEDAVDDVVRAVEFMKEHANIDENRIYLVGASGGGHMALSVASRRPEIWAAVSAWVPITDLAAWYDFSKSKGSKYANMIKACCGGVYGDSEEVDYQYYLRSPINHLQNAADIPLDINAGIDDGHTGAVPISHTLLAFNKLAEAKGVPEKMLTDEEINEMVDNQTIPAGIVNEPVDMAAEGRKLPVLFRRTMDNIRLSVFDGGHTMEAAAAFEWFEGKSK